jgi:ribosomal protein S1
LSDLSHKHISHPEIEFYPGKLVLCRIVNIRNNGFLDISLKELIVKFGIELGLEELKVGKTVKGVVVRHG